MNTNFMKYLKHMVVRRVLSRGSQYLMTAGPLEYGNPSATYLQDQFTGDITLNFGAAYILIVVATGFIYARHSEYVATYIDYRSIKHAAIEDYDEHLL